VNNLPTEYCSDIPWYPMTNTFHETSRHWTS